MSSDAPAAVPETAAPPLFHSWVGGVEVPGRGGRRGARSPASGREFAAASLLDAAQAAEAVAAAERAFPDWRALPFRERARHLLALRRLLLREAEPLAELLAREQGKPVAEAHAAELFPALDALKHLADHAEDLLREETVDSQVLLLAHKDCRIVYEPYGVVLVITPWNYPLFLSVSGVAAALAAGNTVVLKPAPATTLVGLRLGALAAEAGLPPGVLGVVAVDDTLATALVEDPRVAKIVFTGSTATGRKVMASAAKNLTPVVLELGGKDPAIVLRDADLDRAAAGIVWGAFANAGQTCASVERVYVEEPVAQAFVDRVVALTMKLRLGDPADPDVDVGPLTVERQCAIVEEHVKDALARGAKALTGGARPEREGYFYPPTVLTGVDHSMKVMREESFGPLLPILTVRDADEAVKLANDSEYGLTASVWTKDVERGRQLGQRLQAGSVTINDCLYSAGEPTAPWGGFKKSGVGRTHGLAGLREMVQTKYVAADAGRAPALWWYPYGPEFRKLMPAANRAVHGGLLARLHASLRLAGAPRFWRRVRLLQLIRSLDRLL